MSVYPISIEEISLHHKGGTKAYHLIILASENGKSVVVYRYGKIGVFGQMIIERYDTVLAGENAFHKKLREKQNGGYGLIAMPTRSSVLLDAAELKQRLGRALAPVFGPDNYLHLDPDFDIAGVKSSRPEYDEDGAKIDATRVFNQSIIQKALKDQKIAEDEKNRAEIEANTAAMIKLPTYGMF